MSLRTGTNLVTTGLLAHFCLGLPCPRLQGFYGSSLPQRDQEKCSAIGGEPSAFPVSAKARSIRRGENSQQRLNPPSVKHRLPSTYPAARESVRAELAPGRSILLQDWHRSVALLQNCLLSFLRSTTDEKMIKNSLLKRAEMLTLRGNDFVAGLEDLYEFLIAARNLRYGRIAGDLLTAPVNQRIPEAGPTNSEADEARNR